MNYLIAVLAFSAVMVVFATLATVMVEAFHKVIGARANNFQEMLTKLYEDVIEPQVITKTEDATDELIKGADNFVEKIVQNPAIQRVGFLRRIPFLKKCFKTKYASDFDELSTRQFIEQFRDAPIAKKIKEKTDQEAQKVIKHIAYEFERYGQAASIYFQQRATVLSIIASLLLAFTLNVDAIRLYKGLAKEDSLSESVIAKINIDQLQAVYEERIKSGAGGNAGVEFSKIKAEIINETKEIDSLSLPIGHAYFPFCEQTSNASFIDSRCNNFTVPSIVNLTDKPDSLFSIVDNFLNGIIAIFSHKDGYIWILRTVLTGLLIGLGAPFWFKTYRFVAQFVPGRQTPPEDSLRDRQNSGQPSASTPKVELVIKNSANSEVGVNNAMSISSVDTPETLVKETSQKSVSSDVGLTGSDLHSILMSKNSNDK